MKKIPFLYTLIRGAIGKEFVIKHYGKRIVMTKFPDMTNIVPSKKQKDRRMLFAEAVAYAKHINNDVELKRAYRVKIKKGGSVYRAAIKEYLRLHKEACSKLKTGKTNTLQVVKPVQRSKVKPRNTVKFFQPFYFTRQEIYLSYYETG
jgi:hypothetical protein